MAEFLAQCPNCLTFETVWIYKGQMEPTRKFKQLPSGIYHYRDGSSLYAKGCGDLPCKLFPKEEQGGKIARIHW